MDEPCPEEQSQFSNEEWFWALRMYFQLIWADVEANLRPFGGIAIASGMTFPTPMGPITPPLVPPLLPPFTPPSSPPVAVPPVPPRTIAPPLEGARILVGQVGIAVAGVFWPSNGWGNDKPGECYGTLTCPARPVYNESGESDADKVSGSLAADATAGAGESVEPFAEDFPTFEGAVGEVEPGSITGIELIPSNNPGAIAQGYTEKWVGTDRNGGRVSAFRNPRTGRFSGGGPSSGIP